MNFRGARNGYSLLELLLVMSALSVLMVINLGWLHQSMKFSSSMTQNQRHHQALTRLAWMLRDDVRECKTMSINGQQLLLNCKNGNQVQYTITKTGSVQVKKKALSSPTSSNTIREEFKLHPGSNIRWDASELPDWISLIVYRANRGNTGSAKTEARSSDEFSDSVPIDLHVRVAPTGRSHPIFDVKQSSVAASEESK